MQSMPFYNSPRLTSQILSMQKRRTLAPNLRCLKVSVSFSFKTGAQANIFFSHFSVLQKNTWSLISMIKET